MTGRGQVGNSFSWVNSMVQNPERMPTLMPTLMRNLSMRNLFAIALLTLAIFTFTLSGSAFSPPVLAATLDGAKIFSTNCAACHAGGGNLINMSKTLQKEVLEKYEMKSLTAVKTQVTKGKNAMPAFGGRLSPEQIETVAAYVLDKAEQGW